MHIIRALPNMEYGKLTVLHEADSIITDSGKRRRMVLCKCQCGTTDIFWAEALYTGNTTSCGCSRLGMDRIEATASACIRSTECYSDIWQSIQTNNTHVRDWVNIAETPCFYCNKQPLQVQKGRKDRGDAANVDWIHNGWDAVDPTKGHTLDNVVSCCKQCNRAKNDLSLEAFIRHIANMIGYRHTIYGGFYASVDACKLTIQHNVPALPQAIEATSQLEVGETFGQLTLIELTWIQFPCGKTQRVWKCQCKCGAEVVRTSNRLKSGRSRSCSKSGCVSRTRTPYEAALMIRLARTRNDDKRKGRDTLSLADFAKLATMNCVYCGCAPSGATRDRISGETFAYSGLDRLDNSLGHTYENCVPCCKHCNYIKGELSLNELNEYLTHLFTMSSAWLESFNND